MNFSKIRLNNERNGHVTKRLNRLNTWNFFKVLYRENTWRLFGFSLLMLACLAPMFAAFVYGGFSSSSITQSLPQLNSFGFSTGIWDGMDAYIQQKLYDNNIFIGLLAVAGSVVISLVLSGGLAVVRDAFWTGKLSSVGVFRSIGKGIKANFLYALISNVVMSFTVFGLYCLYMWMETVLPLWAAIVIIVVLSLIAALLFMYLLILCSVTVTYKQSVYENLDDSWRLMWLNILPNIIHFVLALIPIGLYFLFQSSMLNMIFMVIMLMFGGLYFPLVWQTHMMKTFALFHPVEVKKKRANKQQANQPQAEQTVADTAQLSGKKSKKGKGAKNAAPETELPKAVSDAEDDDSDPYAIEEDEEESVSEQTTDDSVAQPPETEENKTEE